MKSIYVLLSCCVILEAKPIGSIKSAFQNLELKIAWNQAY